MGVFVLFPSIVSCGSEDYDEILPAGYVYAGVLETENDQVHKLNATTGKKEFGIGGKAKSVLSIEVDPTSGDVFIYSTNSLKKYSKAGELSYDVYVYSGLDHDKMVFDGSTRDVWAYTTHDGKLHRFNKETGKDEFSFRTGLIGIGQLVYDDEADSFWIVKLEGLGVLEFSKTGERLLEIKANGELTALALDPGNNTLLVGYYDSVARKNFVRRYQKNGNLVNEFATGLSPVDRTRFVAVEPGSRRIWVSDRTKTEVYDETGVLYRAIEGKGYVRGDFENRGEMFFGITAKGEVSALRLPSFDTLWTSKTVTKREYVLAIKYSTY